MTNIFMNHPQFLFKETINTANIDVSVFKIPMTMIQPFNAKVTAVADTGANIEVIGTNIAMTYKQYLQSERRKFKVRTANGNVLLQKYLPVHVKNGKKLIKVKFYVMWDLPYDYLIGRSLIHSLGWRLTHPTESFYHKADCIEEADDCLDMINCTAYPLLKEQTIDVSKVTCTKNEELKSWIIEQLKKYNEIVAQHETDSGEIPNAEFRIDFKDDIDTTPLAYKEYPHSITHIAEIERQLK